MGADLLNVNLLVDVLAVYLRLLPGRDVESHLTAFHTEYGNLDIVTNPNDFVNAPGGDQKGEPLSPSEDNSTLRRESGSNNGRRRGM